MGVIALINCWGYWGGHARDGKGQLLGPVAAGRRYNCRWAIDAALTVGVLRFLGGGELGWPRATGRRALYC